MFKKLKSIIPLLVLLNSPNVFSQEVDLKYNIAKNKLQGVIVPITATLKITEGNPHTRIDGTSEGEIFGLPFLGVRERESFAVVDSTGYPIDLPNEFSTIWHGAGGYEVGCHNLMSALYDLINRDLKNGLIYYKIKKGNSEYIVEFRRLRDEEITIDDKLSDATLLEGSVIVTSNENKDEDDYRGIVYVMREKPHYLLKGSLESSKHGKFEGKIDSKSYERLESMLKKSDASSSKKPRFPITIRQ